MICPKFPKLPLKTVYLEIAADWLKAFTLAEKESKFQKQVEVLSEVKTSSRRFYDDVWFVVAFFRKRMGGY